MLSLEQAKQLHQQGQLEEARAAYLAILTSEPDNVEALQLLAVLCAENDDLDRAIEYLKTAIGYAPNDLSIQLNLGNLFKAKGLLPDAESILLKIIQVSPQSATAHNNLGTIYFVREQWDAAIKSFQMAIDITPDYADAYYNLGLALSKNKQYVDARNVYEALLMLVPQHVGARFQRACIDMQQGNYRAAIEHFNDIALEYPHHFETQTNLATCYLRLGALPQAKSHYLQALELMADDTQLLFNLGVISMQQGRINEAIHYYLACLRINPDYFEAHNNLGAAYFAMGDRDASIRHFHEAARLHPHDESVKHTLTILTNKQPLVAAPVAYIQSLFDSYADHYEQHVVDVLKYQVPDVMKRVLQEAGYKALANLDILDLGCGTGLCGEKLLPYAKALTGVDLSESMLAIAAVKKCYNRLINKDFVEFLASANDTYDLVVAGDAIVYLSDLTAIFKSIHRILKPGGGFIFNIEKSVQETDYMPVSGRFAHQATYIERLLEQLKFNIVTKQDMILRTQDKIPVSGVVYLVKKP